MLTLKEITALQDANGASEIQSMINDGTAWKMEGSIGRYAMDCLEQGICFLPNKPQKDIYGNTIPSLSMVKEGSIGSRSLSSMYWSDVTNFEELD
tara:strand:- start:11787 stop:12071 length:285 start_codon:yes stop_codon:yes gene_type:complete